MRVSSKVFVAAVGILGMSMQAEALTITAPATTTPTCPLSPVCLAATGTQTSQAQIDAAIAPYIGASVDLYKADAPSSESGPFSPDYTTTFSPPSDPQDALIQWVGGSFISASPVYLLVKDGSATPAWYLFTITGWDGQEAIDLQDFWPSQGAISHVTIYGPASSVPDGGSMAMLLGIGLMGLAALRRRLSQN